MNGDHPTWGGSAVFTGGRWEFITGSKLVLPAHAGLDPYTHWGRNPAYNKAAADLGEDPFGGSHPWEFSVDATVDPFPTPPHTKIESSRDVFQPKAWLSLYRSDGSDAAGPYTEVVSKWFKAFRADLKVDPITNALLCLSNAGGGFTIIQSTSGSIDGPWTDFTGTALDPAWTGVTQGVEPTPSTPMPKPVYTFSKNGHCHKATHGVLAGKYVTRDAIISQYRECTTAEKAAWNCHLADPALLVHSDGKAVIAYRGTKCESADGHVDHTERLGLLVSSASNGWKGPYTKLATPVFQDHEVQNGGLEDLFMWVDSRGTHLVVHSQAQDHALDPSLDRATFFHKKKRGAYAFSADGVQRWSLSDWELFPSEIRWDDGTTQFLLKQQRPSLIFDPVTKRPTHLITGVDFIFDDCCDWYGHGSGWTLVQPLSTCPAGQILQGSSCAQCEATSSDYSGRCDKATSKYGSCVCAACRDGYSGDQCETAPAATYETRCQALQASHMCEDMGGTAKWIGRTQVGDGTCLQECEAMGQSEGTAGCCFQYRDPANPSAAPSNCRFFPGQQAVPNAAYPPDKAASYCTRVTVS